MISLSNFSLSVSWKEIIHSIDYSFEAGKITAILGHNGSGKSSLALALMGHPRYEPMWGYTYKWISLHEVSPVDRKKMGIFLSLQSIPEIPGIKLLEYLRTIYNEHFSATHPGEKLPTPFVFRRMIEKMMPEIGLDVSFLERDLFVGFSGGEKRRIEMLQVALLDPECIILDEIDSGLDIDAISFLWQRIAEWKEKNKTIIIITHNFHLLDTIAIDNVMVMQSGKIAMSGSHALVEQIRKNGFR
jgi:Fe-S cluster assembly ATP-binding protein